MSSLNVERVAPGASTSSIESPASPAADVTSAPGTIGLATSAATQLVAGTPNAGLTLDVPAGATPRGVVSAQSSYYAAMPMYERQERIRAIAQQTGAFIGGLNDYQGQQEFLNLLWSTPRYERQQLAYFMAQTQVARSTFLGTDYEFIDRLADSSLSGEAWRSFSFFMYQHTAGFGDNYYDPIYSGGYYRGPDWWYSSRPYDGYRPYWEYGLPYNSPFYNDPYYRLPPIIINIPGRDPYRSGDRQRGNSLPGGPGNSIPGGGNRIPGGPGNSIPGGPGNSIPGGPGNRIPGGPGNSIPGGPGNSIPGGPGNSIPGGPNRIPGGGDRIPSGPGNSIPGGPNRIPGGGLDTRPAPSTPRPGNNMPGNSIPGGSTRDTPRPPPFEVPRYEPRREPTPAPRYEPPSRNTIPGGGYSPPPSRSYEPPRSSPPSRSYDPPSRSYEPPRSSGGSSGGSGGGNRLPGS